MIETFMYNGRWRVKITNEEWEFPTVTELNEVLGGLVTRKEKYGRIHGVKQ